MTLKYIWRSFSLGCHFHVHFSYPWHAFASHGLPAIAELLVYNYSHIEQVTSYRCIYTIFSFTICEMSCCINMMLRDCVLQAKLHYKNTKIHRIVPDFVIQMGDTTVGDGTGGMCVSPLCTAAAIFYFGNINSSLYMSIKWQWLSSGLSRIIPYRCFISVCCYCLPCDRWLCKTHRNSGLTGVCFECFSSSLLQQLHEISHFVSFFTAQWL